ncbi:hypothetical protein GOBAR_AA25311 [Gossypium barbadense]|uniref:Uncharacterized protein n=1 Tax=Gossypium barbadense TaxID=3634 RepID=A0A2P5WW88_GOSBA|nr:hypothetical protein GOBAR_AA25311 [Gossypium barbadense]
MVAPISYIDSQSTICRIDIDFNAASETDVVGDDGYDSSDSSNHEVDSDSDPDIDKFPKYPDILPAHRLAINSGPEELFVG